MGILTAAVTKVNARLNSSFKDYHIKDESAVKRTAWLKNMSRLREWNIATRKNMWTCEGKHWRGKRHGEKCGYKMTANEEKCVAWRRCSTDGTNPSVLLVQHKSPFYIKGESSTRLNAAEVPESEMHKKIEEEAPADGTKWFFSEDLKEGEDLKDKFSKYELELIQRAEKTGVAAWLLQQFFVAYAGYLLYIDETEYNLRVDYTVEELVVKPEQADDTAVAAARGAAAAVAAARAAARAAAAAAATTLNEKNGKQNRSDTKRRLQYKNKWKLVKEEHISSFFNFTTTLERTFTLTETIFYLIVKSKKIHVDGESARMHYVDKEPTSNEFGKWVRDKILSFCRNVSDTDIALGIIKNTFDNLNTLTPTLTERFPKFVKIALQQLEQLEELEELEELKAELGNILKKGNAYDEKLEKKWTKALRKRHGHEAGVPLITPKAFDIECHVPRTTTPHTEIFMDNLRYDEVACWLWLRLQQEAAERNKVSYLTTDKEFQENDEVLVKVQDKTRNWVWVPGIIEFIIEDDEDNATMYEIKTDTLVRTYIVHKENVKFRDTDTIRDQSAEALKTVPTQLRHLPESQNWDFKYILNDAGTRFSYIPGNNRTFARCWNFKRCIEVDDTYLKCYEIYDRGKYDDMDVHMAAECQILRTIAHELGHGMSMFGRHSADALFRQWSRYFGEPKPREFDRLRKYSIRRNNIAANTERRVSAERIREDAHSEKSEDAFVLLDQVEVCAMGSTEYVAGNIKKVNVDGTYDIQYADGGPQFDVGGSTPLFVVSSGAKVTGSPFIYTSKTSQRATGSKSINVTQESILRRPCAELSSVSSPYDSDDSDDLDDSDAPKGHKRPPP